MNSTAAKTYPYTAEMCAVRDGHKLLAVCDLPHDPHLQIVLCGLPGNDLTPWVVWYFNKGSGGFGTGAYCRNLLSAAFAYTRRCMRYDGVPGDDLPSEDEIKAADEQLWPR